MLLLPRLHRYAHSSTKYSACMAIYFNHIYPSQLRFLNLVVRTIIRSALCAFPNVPVSLFIDRMGWELRLYWEAPRPAQLCATHSARAFSYILNEFSTALKERGKRQEALRYCLVLLQVTRTSLCACPQGQENLCAISSLLCWLKASPSSSLLSLLWFRWGSGIEEGAPGRLGKGRLHLEISLLLSLLFPLTFLDLLISLAMLGFWIARRWASPLVHNSGGLFLSFVTFCPEVCGTVLVYTCPLLPG